MSKRRINQLEIRIYTRNARLNNSSYHWHWHLAHIFGCLFRRICYISKDNLPCFLINICLIAKTIMIYSRRRPFRYLIIWNMSDERIRLSRRSFLIYNAYSMILLLIYHINNTYIMWVVVRTTFFFCKI